MRFCHFAAGRLETWAKRMTLMRISHLSLRCAARWAKRMT
jgi:hypothetical protein